jgi:hypothetical protein
MFTSRYIMTQLDESRHSVISVDVQPAYKSYIKFDIKEYVSFLNESGKILVFYVSDLPDDSNDEKSIYEWYLDAGLDTEKRKDMVFFDKGEGFFTNWISAGVSEETILKTVRYLLKNGIYGTDEIKGGTLEKIMGDEYTSELQYEETLYLGLIDPKLLKRYSGSYLCGGGSRDCLEEVRLYMEALRVNYTIMGRFIY